MASKSSALYPYTLQPVALNMTEEEFKQAQYSLFEQSAQNFGVSNIKKIEWIIMVSTAILAVAGLVYVKGYSTILFWLMLAGIVIYLLLRIFGMKWYMKREFQKQLSEAEMPAEIKQVKLGVQKHGLIMSMPAPKVDQNHQKRGKGKRKIQMSMKMPSHQQAMISWDSVTSWDETRDFMFVMFEIEGQRGSQIIPKRLKSKNFPIDSVRKHLLEVRDKGLETDSIQN